MKITLRLIIVLIFSFSVASIFSQKKSDVIVTGTVYVSSSTSLGTLNGGSTTEPERVFKKQPIYFKNDSTTIKGETDSLGIFSIILKEGVYTVYQQEGLNKGKSGMVHYGSMAIEVKNDNDPYKIILHNSSYRRSTLDSGMPSSGGTKTTKKSK